MLRNISNDLLIFAVNHSIKQTVASWNMLPVSVGVTLVHAAPTSIRKSMSRQTRESHISLCLVQRRHGVVNQRRRTTSSSCTGEWETQCTTCIFMEHWRLVCLYYYTTAIPTSCLQNNRLAQKFRCLQHIHALSSRDNRRSNVLPCLSFTPIR